MDTKPDMEHRMQITSAVFFKHLHLWKHEEVAPEQKLGMFNHLIAKLVYAGAVTWILDDKALRKLNGWVARS